MLGVAQWNQTCTPEHYESMTNSSAMLQRLHHVWVAESRFVNSVFNLSRGSVCIEPRGSVLSSHQYAEGMATVINYFGQLTELMLITKNYDGLICQFDYWSQQSPPKLLYNLLVNWFIEFTPAIYIKITLSNSFEKILYESINSIM